jgi:ABC-2 type transport system permease protein
MNVLSLLKKEVLWSRHRLVTLLLLLLVLPAFFAYTTVAFQTVVPEDSPIAIVPENENVSENGVEIITGGASLFSDPEVYQDKSEAMTALRRESVYAVLEVPPGILNESTANATFSLYVDGSIVPFGEPSKAIRGIMGFYLNENLPAGVSVERVVVGNDSTLSEYLLPVFLMGLLMLFAFTYVPYNLAREADVLERLLVEASLEEVILTKVAYFAGLMIFPILSFTAVATYLGYSVALLRPAAVAVFLLTFAYLTAISVSIMILTDFSTFGRFVNVAALFAAITFSSLVYPVGFFSPLRREVARLIPLHYSMIVTRSLTLKDVSVGLFADWLVVLVGFTAATALLVKLSIVRYERTR